MPNSSAPQTRQKGERAEALPANLRRLRLEAQLTLDRLGALSGVSRAMISKIERGASVPTATVLGKLAAALQVSLSQLLGEFHARQPRLHGMERQAVYHDPASGFERRSLSPLFEDGAVRRQVLLLGGIGLPTDVQELRAIQADAVGPAPAPLSSSGSAWSILHDDRG